MAGRANGQVSRDDLNRYNLEPGVAEETYNKVHHDLDVAAAKRKPIVTESKYKVKVAEPGVDSLHLEDHEHIGSHVDQKKNETKSVSKSSYEMHSSKSQTQEKPKSKPSTAETQKGQFIAKPDVYNDKSRGEPDDDNKGGFSWFPWLAGAATIAGIVAGAMYVKKKNPDADQRVRRVIEDGDHRVKEFIGSGEQRVKDLIGGGKQKINDLVHRGDHGDDGSDRHSGSGMTLLDGGSYHVKQGDNLTKIARKTGKNSWHDIADRNPNLRNPDLIYPGDKLKL
uniref:LysM domain-containing protein n=1 Tax=Physcomitrium patens TaxID=3218 RepID=A0A2K1J9Q5_PHYPA|nr:hypothetical protein PHYPA_021381 [Physcomitrium patens]